MNTSKMTHRSIRSNWLGSTVSFTMWKLWLLLLAVSSPSSLSSSSLLRLWSLFANCGCCVVHAFAKILHDKLDYNFNSELRRRPIFLGNEKKRIFSEHHQHESNKTKIKMNAFIRRPQPVVARLMQKHI